MALDLSVFSVFSVVQSLAFQARTEPKAEAIGLTYPVLDFFVFFVFFVVQSFALQTKT